MENKVYKVILVQQQTSDASKIDVKQAGRKAALSYLGQSAKQQGQDRVIDRNYIIE